MERDYSTTWSTDVRNISDRVYFSKVFKDKITYISNPIISKSTGESIIVIVTPLAAVINLNQFSDDITKLGIKYFDSYSIINGEGKIVAHPDKRMIIKKNINKSFNLISEKLVSLASKIKNSNSGMLKYRQKMKIDTYFTIILEKLMIGNWLHQC
ncbi:hypothetical protein U472_09080 [Orenia metallireducens]|uniref:Cache domain-containing protein n=1 Tax=Orenia metallireducens TaxID=1413210 RepID=A0A1C0A7G5_9FIRM|nr:cache domain-containing protein [Orenia metallireducens]OCL26158.1 hypothetical protein U472_09080 [Orenia metallireducens]